MCNQIALYFARGRKQTVDWVDHEGPMTAKNSLETLWGMYHDNSSAMIIEMVDSAKLVNEIADEKNKIEKKYFTLLVDVKKIMDDAEKKVLQENLASSKDNTANAEEFGEGEEADVG
jgi:hypothetical protein